MALIKCKECGKEISDTLKICPNCGIEINNKIEIKNNKKSSTKIVNIIIIIIFSLYALLSLRNCYYCIQGFKYEFIRNFIEFLIYLLMPLTLGSVYAYYKTKKNIFKTLTIIILLSNIILFTIYQVSSSNFEFSSLKYLLRNIIDRYSIISILCLFIIGENKNGSN